MDSRFGRRLFRLFFAFSLLPLVAMAVVGYYLATESIEIVAQEQPVSSEGAIRYYNDYIAARIDSALSRYGATDVSDDLDFIVIYNPQEMIDTVIKPGDLTEPSLRTLISATGHDRKGLLRTEAMTLQYSSRLLDANRVVIGGVVHRLNLDSLMATLQSGISARAARREARFDYLTFLGFLFAMLAVLSGTVAYLFSKKLSRGISQPLTELSRATSKIAGGDFSVRTDVSGRDEIAELQATFNNMASRLETTTARLAQTERVAAWRNIARRLAHDLRNPLQPIIVSLYQIEKNLSESDGLSNIKEPLRAAKEELEQLKILAERFSNLAKLPPPQVKMVDLSQLLTQIADLYRRQLGDDEFICSIPSTEIVLDCDETYLREILHNLIKNGIEAIGDSGAIDMGVEVDDSHVRIVIRDTGKGMDPQTLAAARLPYFTTKSEGSGLGLAVVEKTLAEMGGNLLIVSAAGAGTTVTVELPRRRNP